MGAAQACKVKFSECIEQLAKSVAMKLEGVLTVTLFERLAQCPDNQVTQSFRPQLIAVPT